MANFEIDKDEKAPNSDECWLWRLFDDEGNIVAVSDELFLVENIKKSIKLLQKYVTPATPVVLDGSDDEKGKEHRFSYSQKEDGKWHWCFQVAGNNQALAIDCGGLPTEDELKHFLEKVIKAICSARIGFKNPTDDPTHDARKANEDEKTHNKKGVPGS